MFFSRNLRNIYCKRAADGLNPELKCRERCAGDGPRAPAIDEGNSQNRERNEKHESNANTISAEESAVADSGGGHGSEPAADLGLRVG